MRLLWWLFLSSAGASTRVKMVEALHAQPRNAQQLAVTLEMDYTTIRHHLRVLASNHLVDIVGERYGQVYFLSQLLESRWSEFEDVTKKMKRVKGGK
jgi:DNA-binding transcriptional ArsR family regulator